MRRAALIAIALAASVAALPAVAATPAVPRATGHGFDTAGAYALARTQVALGPRPAGSAPERAAADLLVGRLPHGRLEAIPGGLRNVVGDLPGRGGPAILLIAHYDTTDVPGYLGANNSAAAVGAVVEIADALATDARSTDRPIRFLLTDGEEAPPGSADFYSSGLRGSRAYAATHRGQIADVIVMDFVANHGLRIPREIGSDPHLWARLRAAAAAVNEAVVFPPAIRGEVLDDHTPFTRLGVPAIDLIDFDYPCWQKVCDTLAQVSRRSLAASGTTVLELLRRMRR